MVKPPTPISGVPLKKLQVRKDSASTVYYPASHVKSNLTVTIDKEWSGAAKRDILVLRFDHGSLSLQSIKLHDVRSESRFRSQSVSVDKEAKLLCLDAPNESTKVLAWFEDTRDFVVTVAVLQKAGFTVRMSSMDELSAQKSRPSSLLKCPGNDNISIPLHPENSSSSMTQDQNISAIRQSSTQDHQVRNRETSLSSSHSFQAAARELSPWQLPLSSKGNLIHSPRVSSPLRASAPLVTPLSLDARGVSADPLPKIPHVPNFYRTVSVPVGISHAFQQSTSLQLEHNSISQPLPQRIPSPVTTTTTVRSDNEDSRPKCNASPRNILDYKNEMPRPRSLPFSPETKRMRRQSPMKVPKKGEIEDSEKAIELQSARSKRSREPNTYKDSSSICNFSEPKRTVTVDSSSNTDSSIANNINATTQTLPPQSISFAVLMEDSNEFQDLHHKISRLLEQYECDISSGYNVPRYAEFYATQIEAIQAEFLHSQLYPDQQVYYT